MTLSENLQRIGACKPAVEWSKQFNTLDEAWAACDRADWMLWLLMKNAYAANSAARATAEAAYTAADADAIRKLYPVASKVILHLGF